MSTGLRRQWVPEPADARTAVAMQRLFYEHSRLSLVALALLAGLQTVYASRHHGWPVLSAWLALALLLLGLRWRWRRERLALDDTQAVAQHGRWQQRAVWGSAAVGLLWSWAMVLDFRSGDVPSQMFCAMLICITCVASITVMAPLPAAYWALVWPPTLTLLWLLLARLGGAAGGFFALLSVCATLMSLSLVGRHARLLFDGHAMRYEREDLLERLQRADASRRRLLAAASHDLRQPVHALGLWTHQLQQSLAALPLPADSRTALAAVDDTLRALDRLIAELMDLGQLEAGGLVLRRQPVDLAALLERLYDELAPQADQRILQWRLRCGEAWTDSDPVQLERMLRNLLANALRYTRHGGVLLACRRRGGQWSVQVWDTGPGIAIDQQERVFDEFVQLGNPERDRNQGQGLGLAIVRRLGQQLGHAVSLRSRPGRGSCFSIELPAIARVAAAAGPSGVDFAPPAPAPAPASAIGCGVLLIEDDAAVRSATQALLQGWGCQVQACANLAELEVWLKRLPGWAQAVVSDWRLPDGDGVQAIARVRAAATAPVPALLVTGEARPPSAAGLAELGIELAPKPLRPSALRAWLLSAEAGASVPPPPPPAPDCSPPAA